MMNNIFAKIVLKNVEQTIKLGLLLGRICVAGDVIGLSGDLGAGKTTLVQAITSGAGVDETEYVCSPSYSLVHEYNGLIPIYHMDFYRLREEDVVQLGLDEYFFRSGISLVEWYDKAHGLFPDNSLIIKMEIDGEQRRTATICSADLVWQERLLPIIIAFEQNKPQ